MAECKEKLIFEIYTDQDKDFSNILEKLISNYLRVKMEKEELVDKFIKNCNCCSGRIFNWVFMKLNK